MNLVETVALAGLLHDVGKFRQRSMSEAEFSDFRSSNQRLADDYLPRNQGDRPSHWHALAGDDWLNSLL
ncbi:MAG TPA: hypothetical protein PLB62_11655, partial [Candidatus Sumerlaeota bacterium]|nr:hypothetical protein [Candidatus Sumerlaeota bacterium]